MLSNTLGRKMSGFVTVESDVVFHEIIMHRKSQSSPVYLINSAVIPVKKFP